MPTDWSPTTLGDCADFFSGGTPRKANADNWGGTIPWFSAKDLKSFYLSDSEDHVTEEGAKAGTRLMPAGTILLLVRGMTLHKDVPIGVLTREATFNQDIKAIKARGGVQQSFLAHWLVSQKPRLLSTVHAAGHGTGVLATDRLHALELELPPPVEQAAIANVFDLIEDKIEQNRRASRALECLARSTFKAWFVDFEPVKAKAAGAAAFPGMPAAAFAALPDCLTDSPLGQGPEGWEVLPLSETIKLTMGQSPKSEFYNTEGRGLPFHQGVTDYGFRFPTDRVYCTTDGRLAAAGDVLLSVRAPVGRINVADRQLILGRGLAGMRHFDDQQSFLLYQMLHTFAEEDAIGDGTIYKAVNKDLLSAMPLLSPPPVFRQAFEAVARPLDELIVAGEKESAKLAALRDYLLPRLLSGRVQVRPSQRR